MLHLHASFAFRRIPKLCSPSSLLVIHPRHGPIQPNVPASSPFQSFSSTPFLFKKKDRGKPNPTADSEAKSAKTAVTSEDPSDLSQLQEGIVAAVSRLKDELSKLRMGGRLGTDAIENLRVQFSKGSKETVKLGDLAQVIPKSGRLVAILVSEEEHIKPITSAIVSSNLSLTPQSDPHNTLQLNVPIPPPTKESRDKTVIAAKSAMEKSIVAVRESRGVVHKRLQEMQKKKIARPDDVRKAQDQMEKLTEKGQREVKDLFEAAKKSMERT
ncbi:putative ribosome recycling factor [Aspergillus steynii IBT 23096]|uniref:Putative ribosome recycling factor n=1 Tax=Aspergillus steynii IBT 23096 TaxID=1392250 RepID=A0A2I2FVN1_9EURO|nr:putative ribosome recycling factor [Aspergillus steynii IBT 23096]PLB44685.1 putative ribosome recycling factor [Aspergillus steynii IBT 23096]